MTELILENSLTEDNFKRLGLDPLVDAPAFAGEHGLQLWQCPECGSYARTITEHSFDSDLYESYELSVCSGCGIDAE